MKLLFVYNADSGKINSLLDIAHKIVSPATYQCSLCSLTHDTLSEKSEWRAFKKSSNAELEFLHKDEFESTYSMQLEYPVILDVSHGINILFSAEQVNQLTSTKDLISAITKIAK